uniref:Uncharacterized protein n=1 Tax=Knipowitschia caucasica TaxID=637954 RepID=A0AAV2JW83_KNICA
MWRKKGETGLMRLSAGPVWILSASDGCQRVPWRKGRSSFGGERAATPTGGWAEPEPGRKLTLKSRGIVKSPLRKVVPEPAPMCHERTEKRSASQHPREKRSGGARCGFRQRCSI